jgi:hypothetical protein
LQHQKKWNNQPGHFHFFISSSNSSWEPKRQMIKLSILDSKSF